MGFPIPVYEYIHSTSVHSIATLNDDDIPCSELRQLVQKVIYTYGIIAILSCEQKALLCRVTDICMNTTTMSIVVFCVLHTTEQVMLSPNSLKS